MPHYKSFISFVLTVAFLGCAYYNILFNAEARYDAGIKKIEESKDKIITSEIRNDFQAAIDKCWKLLNIYSDSSKYADDALLIIGKSHYHMEEYTKSDRFLAQFVERYRDSDMIAEAYLWLGMSLIELDRNEEALDYLNKVLVEDESNDLNARAHLNLGRVYMNQEIYEQARKQFVEVFDLTNDDEYQGNAQFLTAETYYLENKYTESIASFETVLEYDASVDLLFRAILRIVDSYLLLEDYDQAILTLESISSETKFLHKKSVVLAIIGNCYKDQGKFIEATEIYYDILETYPRTEGSAIAAYGMGQLMQFAYADLDSAKGLYQRVGQEYRDSKHKVDADNMVKLITSYQKIARNIEQDLLDLQNLSTEPDEEDEEAEAAVDSSDVELETDSRNGQDKGQKPKIKRTESEIRLSLQKNNFAKSEFFLLTLSSYDSAASGYSKFIKSSEDSILVPKAQYALYYIYSFELNRQHKADSIKQIILENYPESPYATYLINQDNTIKVEEPQITTYKYIFLQGEAMIFDERYPEAIDFFTQIAEEDSGSELAQKARYATAWIYENKLEDIPNAVDAYAVLAEEYPNTKAGKIAQNKIRIPVQAEVDTIATQQDSTFFDENDAIPPSLEEQLDLPLQDSENQNEENQNIPDNPENP
jgi:TolA-binding protein